MRMQSAECGMRISSILLLSLFFVSIASAQIPEPGPARSVNIPAVQESKLRNGLTVAVVEKRNVPIVTVQLLVRGGAFAEGIKTAGLADLTATMLTKGTKTRTAEQIAEQMEFLGGAINSGAGWSTSSVTIGVTSDKLDQAMAIMADVVLNPSFAEKELDLLRTQAIDGLKYNLTQPAFLGNYVASVYSFAEHPAGGTPDSLAAINRASLVDFYRNHYDPAGAVLIFAGDVTAAKARTLANTLFGRWKGVSARKEIIGQVDGAPLSAPENAPQAPPLVKRILVVDLPNSGQASVTYARPVNTGRVAFGDKPVATVSKSYYPALALNSLLGGGYSSRLNQEIRIKRGLSYGAGSSFSWRWEASNFGTRTQTKNESAAEVAELVLTEIKRLTEGSIADSELGPRKSVLAGTFGRNLETTGGLAGALADLYTFEIATSELNKYVGNVNAVTDDQIRSFASANLLGGDIIIVGDYAKFKDDLAKRFPNMKIDVVKVDELNIESPTLRKSDIP
ncbi:MAG TPA: pitrilysin family protein [Pyrinomonadaceae bacterium]